MSQTALIEKNLISQWTDKAEGDILEIDIYIYVNGDQVFVKNNANCGATEKTYRIMSKIQSRTLEDKALF